MKRGRPGARADDPYIIWTRPHLDTSASGHVRIWTRPHLDISPMPHTPATRRTWTGGTSPWMMLSNTQAHRHARRGLPFGGGDEYDPGTRGRCGGHAAAAAARGAAPGWPVGP